MAHFYEGRADGNSLLAVEEDSSSFCLGSGSHDSVDGLTFGEDCSVWSGIIPDVGQWWIVAQVLVACSATARFGLNEIRCVTVDVEAHVASVELDDGARLPGCVVHHYLCFLDGVCVGRSLLGANFF